MVMKEIRNEDEEVSFAQLIKVGDKVEGKLAEVKDSEKYSKIYTLENDKGRAIIVFGKTNLNPKMKKAKIGDLVSIELVELIKTKSGNHLKNFKVMIDDGKVEEETIR